MARHPAHWPAGRVGAIREALGGRAFVDRAAVLRGALGAVAHTGCEADRQVVAGWGSGCHEGLAPAALDRQGRVSTIISMRVHSSCLGEPWETMFALRVIA